MPSVEIEQLLNAGAHFGHLTRRWNPRMRPYIFMQRNGIHIIDLKKTQSLIDEARDAAEKVAAEGKRILYVGTKKQARDIVREEALRSGMNFVSERWLGGMLTNFATIRKSIKRLSSIEKMETDGTYDNITKKERLMLSREKERLIRVLGGIVDMTRLPGALFIIDIRKEHLAVKEAKTLGIPVFAIVDTNVDPTTVDYPIPANDDSLKTIALITKAITDGVIMGREASKSAITDAPSSQEMDAKEAGYEEGSETKIRTRRRTRAHKGDEQGATGDEEKDSETEMPAVAPAEGADKGGSSTTE